jgi:aspartate/methionine/tyrosine aminotransferase
LTDQLGSWQGASVSDAAGRGLLSAHENLLVLRTFSKAFGFAGLRVGNDITSVDITSVDMTSVDITSVEVASPLRLAKTPSSVGSVAAVASLLLDALDSPDDLPAAAAAASVVRGTMVARSPSAADDSLQSHPREPTKTKGARP